MRREVAVNWRAMPHLFRSPFALRSLVAPRALCSTFAASALLFGAWSCKPETPTTTVRGPRVSATAKRKRRTPRPIQVVDNGGNADGAVGASNEGNLLLGNPSNAGKDENNYLLERPQYSLSFNHGKGESNWVAWHVDSADFGDTDRGKFQPDPELPAEWQITPADYKGSGFDRGHICPSGDRTSSRAENDATFYMSNMLPQTAQLNQHIWADLENYDRSQVRAGNEIYQMSGGIGKAGTIADGAVVVPQSCWKIVVILPQGEGDLRRINANTRVIAVNIPNTTDPKLQTEPWADYLTTVTSIEAKTGLRFFSKLPAKVQQSLKDKRDNGEG